MTITDIGWLVSNVMSSNLTEVTCSELASSRMRAGVCIKSALLNNFTLSKLNLLDNTRPKLLFMSKYVHDSGINRYIQDNGVRWSLWLDLIREVKKNGTKFIVDYTDNHLSGCGIVADFYKEILPYVDGYVVPSNMMSKNISVFSNKPIWVIPEPVEVKITAPKNYLVDSKKLNILWFGHNSNLPYLYKMIQGSLKSAPAHNLLILSNHLDQTHFKKIVAAGSKFANYSYAKWSLGLMEKISAKIDICIIPGDIYDSKKNGVSPGRLLTSLAMGLPTIATPLDSYLPFDKYFMSDAQSLESFFSNPLVYKDKILEIQKLIEKKFTVATVGDQWLNICNRIVSN
jgi:hypothetical protein